jgi:hypothetical protein
LVKYVDQKLKISKDCGGRTFLGTSRTEIFPQMS